MTNTEFAVALRKMAEFYEQNPDMHQPHPRMHIFLDEKETFLKTAVALSRGGYVTKKADSAESSYPYYHAIRDFGGVEVDCQIPRSAVCRKIQDAIYECPDSLLEEAKEYNSKDATT
jgi:hypothetical protein